jgi:cobalt-zinc-cadmium resistance protein CzcA
MGSEQTVDIVWNGFDERTLNLSLDSLSISQNPQLGFLKQQVEIAEQERKVVNAKFFPDINVGYFNQTLIGTSANGNGELATSSDRFQGFMVGLSIPIWFVPQSAKVKAARINEEKLQLQVDYNHALMQSQWQQTVQEYIKNKSSVNYYQTSALQNAELILRQSNLAYRNGEIDYMEHWLTVRNALQIRENYLNNLNNLNQSVITLEFLAGVK